jgi:hypothetical protein
VHCHGAIDLTIKNVIYFLGATAAIWNLLITNQIGFLFCAERGFVDTINHGLAYFGV